MDPSKLHSDGATILLYKSQIIDSLPYSAEVKENFNLYNRRLLNPACPLNNSITTADEFYTDLMEVVHKEFGLIMNCNNVQLRSNMKITNKKMSENQRR